MDALTFATIVTATWTILATFFIGVAIGGERTHRATTALETVRS